VPAWTGLPPADLSYATTASPPVLSVWTNTGPVPLFSADADADPANNALAAIAG
jgi:hypothetical protein